MLMPNSQLTRIDEVFFSVFATIYWSWSQSSIALWVPLIATDISMPVWHLLAEQTLHAFNLFQSAYTRSEISNQTLRVFVTAYTSSWNSATGFTTEQKADVRFRNKIDTTNWRRQNVGRSIILSTFLQSTVYPTWSLTVWSLVVALSAIGFEISGSSNLVGSTELYDQQSPVSSLRHATRMVPITAVRR